MELRSRVGAGGVTAAVLLLLAVVQLVDALRGGALVSSPPLMLLTVVAGYLLGVTNRAPVAAACATTAAALLTWAWQVEDPGGYPVLDDFVFALLAVGAPASAGAVVRLRAAQVRELDRLTARLTEQRADQVRLARLEERARVEARLHRGFGEQVAAIVMRAESAHGSDEASARAALADVEEAARAGLEELREALGDLDSDTVAPAVEPQPVVPIREARIGVADVILALTCAVAVAVESVVSPAASGPAPANVLLGLAAGAPLVVRRVAPLVAVTGCSAALLALSLWLTPAVDMVTTLLVLLACGYTVGAHARGPRRVVGAALMLLFGAATYYAAPVGSRDPEGLAPTLLIVGLSIAAGLVGAGWTLRASRRAAALAELERSIDVAAGLAVAEQRERLARELHDTVAHTMTVICLQASAAQVRPDPATVDTIVETARTGLAELRTGLDHLVNTSDLGVGALTDQARRAGLRAQVQVTGRLDDLSPRSRHLAVRVVREAVTNAARYAPGAELSITLDVGETLTVSVRDEGTAHDTTWQHGAGTGLRGLAQEVERAGGELRWGGAGAGFEVSLTLPTSEVMV